MSITQLKVFGERNTGTFWTEDILIKNYDVPLIHHRGIIQEKTTAAQNRLIETLQGQEKRYLREQVTDRIFESQSAQLFGWKHSCVLNDVLTAHPKFGETGFIFLVKHPYSFIKSLHKHPYHSLLKVPCTVDAFISSPWLTVDRDFINPAILNSPIELWNHKVSSYFNFMESNSNTILLRYEDILDNFELLFDLIEDRFSIKSISRLPVSKSTKSKLLTTDDYKIKYLNTDSADGLSSDSIEFMRAVLDNRLTQTCQYDL